MSSKKKFWIAMGVGAVLSAAFAALRGLFSAEDWAGRWLRLCDGSFAAGVLLLAAGMLLWVYSQGLFNGIGFAFQGVFNKKKQNALEGDFRENYRKYQEEKAKQKFTGGWLLLAGGIVTAISLILMAIVL